ncbi:hypothetical protein [Haloarcula sp. JP-L23]|uniref:hypothetical protein n=1 Tax=Haloarcula sp. JP-L23 TaxID=2716717 RepID=UPI00140EB9B2|nr:hypothetical protein G9465_14080 [Haloarcula sp. JP-L23]
MSHRVGPEWAVGATDVTDGATRHSPGRGWTDVTDDQHLHAGENYARRCEGPEDIKADVVGTDQ